MLQNYASQLSHEQSDVVSLDVDYGDNDDDGLATTSNSSLPLHVQQENSTSSTNSTSQVQQHQQQKPHYNNQTGSFANCTNSNVLQNNNNYDEKDIPFISNISNHSYYTGTIQVSCHPVTFRLSTESFSRSINITAKVNIIVGILSSGFSSSANTTSDGNDDNESNSSGQKGRRKRDSIRNTWANDTLPSSNNTNVFFLVAGPWNPSIEHEINTYHDIIWIDQEEVYNGEQSVLTLKTLSFLSIVHLMTTKLGIEYTHVFKTDDDSYVNLHALSEELGVESDPKRHYIGHCQLYVTKVERDGEYKWPLSLESYPEEYLPKYCQGAGYALSKEFVSCAAASDAGPSTASDGDKDATTTTTTTITTTQSTTHHHSSSNIASTRFMPFEDVAVGILAERCHYEPFKTQTGEIKVSRYDSWEAKKRTSKGQDMSYFENLIPITACMTSRIVQHRVIDDYDMGELHKTVLDPLYCKVTRRRRGKKIDDLEARGIKWFG